jgi:hypothetical protein
VFSQQTKRSEVVAFLESLPPQLGQHAGMKLLGPANNVIPPLFPALIIAEKRTPPDCLATLDADFHLHASASLIHFVLRGLVLSLPPQQGHQVPSYTIKYSHAEQYL